MPGCAVADCKNYNRLTKGTDIKYFRFPKDKELCKKWSVACRREDNINLKNACICSDHFEPDCFTEPSLKHILLNSTPKNYRNIKSDAVPTLNIPYKRKINGESDRSPLKKRFENTLPESTDDTDRVLQVNNMHSKKQHDH